MSLLEVENVSKRYREGQRERIVLKDVSLAVAPGELVMVWGLRRSGRTTLLRILAGIEAPDTGVVRLAGRDLAEHGERTLGEGIGYVQKTLRADEEQGVLEQVTAPLLARGVDVRRAGELARQALARAGGERCAEMRVTELGAGEAVRVALARTLAFSPTLLVIDEPAATVELSERAEILALMRTLVAEGVAVIASTGEPAELAGAHRALTLGEGELRGPSTPELAPVVALRRRGV
ncbi:MAG TPA: ATP-binding cassette domain-containing protein [Solirubrobacteraceae bacterium]|nr:ATP-binding cassette domain-containing protein [Solirubrobacteraceae bacterium]